MGSESVKVVVRCRPMNEREKALNCRMVVSVDLPHCQCFIEKPAAKDEPPKQFTFDGTYFTEQTTEQMYNEIAYPLVEGVTEGYNGTIFAYGQTGSGKSFTMQGVSHPAAQKGVIPRAFDHIFESIQCAESTKFLVRASYLEIYNEEVRDLLGQDTKQRMELKEHPERGVYVRDLSMHTVHSVDECECIMERGWKNRSVGYTLMNKDSSRSHSIFTIHLEICNTDAAGEDHLRAGKLNLVDLAGSERQAKTGATGDRLREATKINLSLSALGNVISALVDGRSRYIPYRDSKLTRLLQDSLGGNTRTLMVACLSPADNNYEESLSTLRYANRAKSIQNRPRINEDPKDALLREYQEEIRKLRALLSGQLGPDALPSEPSARLSEASPGEPPQPQSGATEAEKERIKADYEGKLARLQAEYNAEQESKVKLQEDIAALRRSYETKLTDLEQAAATRGRSYPTDGSGALAVELAFKEVDSAIKQENSGCVTQVLEEELPHNTDTTSPNPAEDPDPTERMQAASLAAGPSVGAHTGAEGEGCADAVTTPGPLEQRDVLERLQQLEQEVVGGEQASNTEMQRRHRQRKALADQRKVQLIQALTQDSEEGDDVLLSVYDSIQEEVHAKSQALTKVQGKLKAAELEIRDLQAEFEAERNDYLASLRRMEREGLLLHSLLERMAPLVRRDCNYGNLERLRKDAVWDEDGGAWRLPEVVVQKTSLPAAVAPLAPKVSARRGSAADSDEAFMVEEDKYKEMLDRSNSENVASNYFKSKRASQLLGRENTKGLALHPPPLVGGTAHLSTGGSNVSSPVSSESVLPRPFRLESLGLPSSYGKMKRKKSKMHIPFEGN